MKQAKNIMIPSALFLLYGMLAGGCKSTDATREAAAPAASMERTLVDQHVEARGGLDNLHAIESVKMTGSVYVPTAGMTLPLTIYKKRPGKMLVHVEVPQAGMEVRSGYDGETAWSNNPMVGGLQKVTGEQARSLKEQADIDGVLVDYASKGYAVAYVGEAEVDGQPAQKLRVVRPDSSEAFVYLGAVSFLSLKTEGEGVNPMSGGPAQVESFMSDYRDVNGVMMPFAVEVKMDGTLFQRVSLDEIETNVEVDDAMFAYPKK